MATASLVFLACNLLRHCPHLVRGDVADDVGDVQSFTALTPFYHTSREPGQDGQLEAAFRIVSPFRVRTSEELGAEIVAAETALALKAEVGGAPVVYDSPSVSISLRKVEAQALIDLGTELEAVDGAKVTIPADPRVKGRHGGPVIVSITSYHTGDRIKDLPTVKYGKDRRFRSVSGPDAISATRLEPDDRVDFFMSKTSVSWRGTVNVKVPGLGASVPAHDRPWMPFGKEEELEYASDKAEIRKEVEAVAGAAKDERLRAYRKLARRWHPDKNPDDADRATDIFTYLQALREGLLG